jgi:hypothetical protein
VTETRTSDERLAEAFRAIEDPSADLSDDLRERIWLAVSGQLPAEDRRAIVERMADDPSCAEAWRVAHEMWTASRNSARVLRSEPAPVPAAGPRPLPRHSWQWTPQWLGAAAAVLLATTIGLVTLRDGRPVDEFRTPDGPAVVSSIPEDAALPRDAFRLQWTPGPPGSRYRIRVTTEELTVLVTADELTAPAYVVAASALAPVPAAGRVLWQVEVNLADGQRIASRTFSTRVK